MHREVTDPCVEQGFLVKHNSEMVDILSKDYLYLRVLHNYYRDGVFSLKDHMRLLHRVFRKIRFFRTQAQMDNYFIQEMLTKLFCKIGVTDSRDEKEEIMDSMIYSSPLGKERSTGKMLDLWLNW